MLGSLGQMDAARSLLKIPHLKLSWTLKSDPVLSAQPRASLNVGKLADVYIGSYIAAVIHGQTSET